MQLDSVFISNCNITLHVSGRFLRPSSGALKNCSNSLWCMTLSHIVYTQYDLVRKPTTLDALIGYFTPSHVIHQRLLLQFLSAPDDGRIKRPKPVQ